MIAGRQVWAAAKARANSSWPAGACMPWPPQFGGVLNTNIRNVGSPEGGVGADLRALHDDEARMLSFHVRPFAAIQTLAGFPALTMTSYLALNSGLNRMALRAGM